MNKKLTRASFFIALGLLLPQLFHLMGVAQGGQAFLPMHIPVLLSGFILGPILGLTIGIIIPLISFIITGMPPANSVILMMCELAAYGLFSGLLYKTFHINRKKYGIYISLLGAMLLGRVIYALAIVIAGSLFALDINGNAAVIYTMYTGIPGILIQIIIIPSIIVGLKRGGLLKDD